MPTLKRVSGTPLSVTYRNPEKLSQVASVIATIKPVRREKANYNHIKKSIKISDIIAVPNTCKDVCLTSPVVLEVSWSAPEGITATEMKKLLDKLIEQNGGVDGVFVTGQDAIQTS